MKNNENSNPAPVEDDKRNAWLNMWQNIIPAGVKITFPEQGGDKKKGLENLYRTGAYLLYYKQDGSWRRNAALSIQFDPEYENLSEPYLLLRIDKPSRLTLVMSGFCDDFYVKEREEVLIPINATYEITGSSTDFVLGNEAFNIRVKEQFVAEEMSSRPEPSPGVMRSTISSFITMIPQEVFDGKSESVYMRKYLDDLRLSFTKTLYRSTMTYLKEKYGDDGNRNTDYIAAVDKSLEDIFHPKNIEHFWFHRFHPHMFARNGIMMESRLRYFLTYIARSNARQFLQQHHPNLVFDTSLVDLNSSQSTGMLEINFCRDAVRKHFRECMAGGLRKRWFIFLHFKKYLGRASAQTVAQGLNVTKHEIYALSDALRSRILERIWLEYRRESLSAGEADQAMRADLCILPSGRPKKVPPGVLPPAFDDFEKMDNASFKVVRQGIENILGSLDVDE